MGLVTVDPRILSGGNRYVQAAHLVQGAGSGVNFALSISWQSVIGGTSTLLNGGADYGPDTPGTVTEGVAEFLTALTVMGGVGYVVPGGTYTFDGSKLPAAITGVTVQSAFQSRTAGTGAVWNYTATAASNATVFTACTFRNITFTAPTAATGGGAALFSGTNNAYNKFLDCTFIDVAPVLAKNHGSDLRFYRCNVLQSGSPPATMNSSIQSPVDVLIIDDCTFDFNPTAATNLYVGFAAYGQANVKGPWWITSTRMNPSGSWTIDGAIDTEATSAVFSACYVDRCTIVNGKIYTVSFSEYWVTNCLLVLNTNYSLTLPEFIHAYNPNNNPNPAGTLHVEGCTMIQPVWGGVAAAFTPRAITLHRDSYLAAAYICRNTFYFSNVPSGTTDSSRALIQVYATTNASSGGIGTVEISDNTFGVIENTGTALPALVQVWADGTIIDRCWIYGNRVIGVLTPAVGAIPIVLVPTSAAYTRGVRLGNNSFGTTTVNDFRCWDNNWVGATSPWIDQQGVVSLPGIFELRNNYPRGNNHAVVVSGGTFTYTHGTTGSVPAIEAATVWIAPAGATISSITHNGFQVATAAPAAGTQLPIFCAIGDILVITYSGGPPTMEYVYPVSSF